MPVQNDSKPIELNKVSETHYEVKLILPLIDLKDLRDGLKKNLSSVFFPAKLKPFCKELLPILEKSLPR